MSAEDPKQAPEQQSTEPSAQPKRRPPSAQGTASRLPPARSMSWIDRALLGINRGFDRWMQLLGWVRSQLPQSWQSRLTSSVMNAIAAGLLLLVLIIWSAGSRSAPAAEPQTEPHPKPVATAKPAVSPEQQKIATLQEQVSAITGTYAAGMVQSVQAGFQQGVLLITLGTQWYSLDENQQNQLATDLYNRLKQLEFAQIYLQDPQDRTVARTPFIGNEMILLQRHSPDQPLLYTKP